MYRNGHVGAALLVYAPVGTVALLFGFDTLAVLGGGAAVGLSTLPDYDQRIPGVSHRGPTHTVWFALLVGFVLGFLGGLVGQSAGLLAVLGTAAFGFVVGFGTVGSHVLADALTPAGVCPFTPYRDRHYSLDLVRASNPLANYALLAAGVAAAVAALVFGYG